MLNTLMQTFMHNKYYGGEKNSQFNIHVCNKGPKRQKAVISAALHAPNQRNLGSGKHQKV